MVISNSKKFIFVATPKVASQAIRKAIRPALQKGDWEQCKLFEKKQIPVSKLLKIGHGHIACLEAKEALGDAIFNSYYKFAFVRNPIDRFVSACYFLNRNNTSMQKAPIDQMKKLLHDKEFMSRIHLLPQHYFICDHEDKILVNYLGKYERLLLDFTEIKGHLKTDFKALQTTNKTNNRQHIQLDDELQERLKKYYKKDYQIFNFK